MPLGGRGDDTRAVHAPLEESSIKGDDRAKEKRVSTIECQILANITSMHVARERGKTDECASVGDAMVVGRWSHCIHSNYVHATLGKHPPGAM